MILTKMFVYVCKQISLCNFIKNSIEKYSLGILSRDILLAKVIICKALDSVYMFRKFTKESFIFNAMCVSSEKVFFFLICNKYVLIDKC
jgi:hypothetical protein